jgi:hypothetical protein
MFDKEPWAEPEGFTDPVADESLPHIRRYNAFDPDPVPPYNRLMYEPHEVAAEAPEEDSSDGGQ